METVPLSRAPGELAIAASLKEAPGGEAGFAYRAAYVDFAAQLMAATQESATTAAAGALSIAESEGQTVLRALRSGEGAAEDEESVPSVDIAALEDAAALVQMALFLPTAVPIQHETNLDSAVAMDPIGTAPQALTPMPMHPGLGPRNTADHEARANVVPTSTALSLVPVPPDPATTEPDPYQAPLPLDLPETFAAPARKNQLAASGEVAGEPSHLELESGATSTSEGSRSIAAAMAQNDRQDRGEQDDRAAAQPPVHRQHVEAVTALNAAASVSVMANTSTSTRDLAPSLHSPIVLQVVEGLLQAAERPGQSVRLTLHPEGLGALTLSVGLEGDRVDVRIGAENWATRDLLQMNLPALTRSLSDQGLSVASAQVDLLGGQAGANGSPQEFITWSDGSRGQRPIARHDTEDDSVPGVGTITWGTRVDFRV